VAHHVLKRPPVMLMQQVLLRNNGGVLLRSTALNLRRSCASVSVPELATKELSTKKHEIRCNSLGPSKLEVNPFLYITVRRQTFPEI
jgi:hypothetical protein